MKVKELGTNCWAWGDCSLHYPVGSRCADWVRLSNDAKADHDHESTKPSYSISTQFISFVLCKLKCKTHFFKFLFHFSFLTFYFCSF